MAALEIGPLSNFFEQEEIAAIGRALAEYASAPHVDADDDAHLVEANLDADVLADFRDQLEANEANAIVYLPTEFDDVFEAAGYQIGSSQMNWAFANAAEGRAHFQKRYIARPREYGVRFMKRWGN